LFFFFFQAEDGIRDRNVTGVQTCALPIYVDLGRGLLLEVALDHRGKLIERLEHGEVERREEIEREDDPPVAVDHERLHGDTPSRSEERRVGKECRCWWWRES